MLMMRRILVIIAAVLVLIGIGVSALKYFAGQWYLAQENRNFEQLKEVSKLNCDELPIHCAVRDKNGVLLNSISRGDDRLESLDRRGYTPLYFAVTRGDKEAVEILLGKGANPNVFDEGGDPALLVSVEKKLYEITESLLKHDAQADVEVKDKKRVSRFPLFSPLGYCVTNNDLKCVALLLDHGANVDKESASDVIVNKTLVKKISIYEMAIDDSNVSDEIKRLLKESHKHKSNGGQKAIGDKGYRGQTTDSSEQRISR